MAGWTKGLCLAHTTVWLVSGEPSLVAILKDRPQRHVASKVAVKGDKGGGMHDVSKGQACKRSVPFTMFHSSQPLTKLTERRLETVLQPLEEKQL